MGGHGLDGLTIGHAAERPRIHGDTVLGIGIVHTGEIERLIRSIDREFYVQAVLGRKGPVAGIMRRHRHDRTGPIFHQHVVTDPQRYRLTRVRVNDVASREDAIFLFRIIRAVDLGLSGGRFDEGEHVGFLVQAFDHRLQAGIFGRQHHVGAAVNGINPGGEAGNGSGFVLRTVVAWYKAKIGPGPFATPDPVFLHGLDAFRPAIELHQIIEQALGIVSNLEEPLLPGLSFHVRVTPFALAIDHLLIGQNGIAGRAPIHIRPGLVGQILLEELQKQPLRPAVVVRFARRDFLFPIKADPPRIQLGLHGFDVLPRALARRRAGFDRRILGRESECIPSHGAQHVEALHLLETGHGVANDVVAPVPDMQRRRGVGEHHEAVIFPGIVAQVGLEEPFFGPIGLPARLEFCKRVTFVHACLFPAATCRRRDCHRCIGFLPSILRWSRHPRSCRCPGPTSYCYATDPRMRHRHQKRSGPCH